MTDSKGPLAPPLVDTPGIRARRTLLYRFWKLNKKRAPPGAVQQQRIEFAFGDNAMTAAIVHLLVAKGIISEEEWQRIKTSYYCSMVDEYVNARLAEGWTTVD